MSIDDCDIDKILHDARHIQSWSAGWKNHYRTCKTCSHWVGKVIANLFYEPSTRTSSSFASAMFQIGGSVISINDVNYSSVAKGENLRDTVRTMATFCDGIVLRSREAGDARLASEVSSVPVINAGDGTGEHPTQTLTDLFTIHKRFKTLEGLRICFIGDIENSRTVHSLDKALQNCDKKFVHNYANDWPESDVYYLTRVQTERGSTGSYTMTRAHVQNMPESCIVMHPFPRNEELPTWFDTDSRAVYFDQMRNGLHVRMSVLMNLI